MFRIDDDGGERIQGILREIIGIADPNETRFTLIIKASTSGVRRPFRYMRYVTIAFLDYFSLLIHPSTPKDNQTLLSYLPHPQIFLLPCPRYLTTLAILPKLHTPTRLPRRALSLSSQCTEATEVRSTFSKSSNVVRAEFEKQFSA